MVTEAPARSRVRESTTDRVSYRAQPAEWDAAALARAAKPVRRRAAAKQPALPRLRTVIVAVAGVLLFYFVLSVAGSLIAEQARQNVVSLQADLQRQKILHQGLRAQVDQMGAPGNIAAWAIHHNMVRIGAVAVLPGKPGTKPAAPAKQVDRYASVGGVVGL